MSDEQQLSLDTLGVEICCMSVFSPTGRTIRRLSTQELMGAFDLGKILLPAGVNGDQAASVSQCPFVLTPPVNIVIQLLNHWEASAQLF